MIWYGVHYFALSPQKQILAPPPHRVLADGFFESSILSDIWEGIIATSYLAFVGLGVAIILGGFIAFLMNISKILERAIFPWAVILQVVPIFALIPVINLWFQNIDTWFLGFDANFKKRLIVCVLIALFPIITNTYFGFKSASRNLHDLFKLHNAGFFMRFRLLDLRAAIPSIFVGLRTAAGLSVIGAIVAEYLFRRGPKGIGTLIDTYSGRALYSPLIATILVSSLLGVVIFWGLTILSKSLTRHWHSSAQDLKF